MSRARECFVARPEHCWISVDMPSLELVTLSQTLIKMGLDSKLAETLRARMDPHVLLASNLEAIGYEQGYAMHKAKDPRMKMLRQAAKPVNYGMGGGMSDQSLVLYARQPSNGGIKFCQVDASSGYAHGSETMIGTKGKATGKPLCVGCVEAAKKFRKAWFDTFPEMREYFRIVGDETEVPDDALIDVQGPEGEPTLWIRGRRFSEAANLRFQGLAARMMKDALWRVARACYVEEDSPMFGTRAILFVHDEIIVEAHEELASAAGFEQARLMTEARKYWCPDVPGDPEPAIMRRWFKGAEKVLDAAGGLVPWWPKDWAWVPDQEIMKRDRARSI